MGTRSAYSTINGVVILLPCRCGGLTLVMKVITIEVTLGILLWIGLIIMAQCFQRAPKNHALAVAIELVPL